MALAEPLFTSQLYRENANVDTRICTSHSLILSIVPLASHDNRFFPSAPDFRPPSSSARNFVPKLFYDETAWSGAITFFRFVFVADQFDRQLRCRVSHLVRTIEIFTNLRQIFDFGFRKDYERNSLYHVI